MPAPVAPPVAVAAPVAAVDLTASLQQAGLQLVETSSDKPRPAAQTAAPAQPLGRKPRPVVVIADEPLQIVETKQG